jgi:predicted O-methyltransferase YrrM
MLIKNDVVKLSAEISDIQHQLIRLYDMVAQTTNTEKVVVELGVRYGTSTKALIAAVNDTGGKVFSIDPVQLVSFSDEKKFTFILGDDIEVVKTWSTPIDFLFIDTTHTYEQTLNELNLWGGWVIPHGLITLHDTNQIGVMRAIKEYLSQNISFSFENFPESNGLGVIRKNE